MRRKRIRNGQATERETFFCSWGHHYSQKRSYYNQSFSRGTMCYACQLEVVDELSMKIDWPELSEKRKLMLRAERADRLAKWETTTRVNGPKVEEVGYVYYIRINEHIKIGYAKDVTKRNDARRKGPSRTVQAVPCARQ